MSDFYALKNAFMSCLPWSSPYTRWFWASKLLRVFSVSGVGYVGI